MNFMTLSSWLHCAFLCNVVCCLWADCEMCYVTHSKGPPVSTSALILATSSDRFCRVKRWISWFLLPEWSAAVFSDRFQSWIHVTGRKTAIPLRNLLFPQSRDARADHTLPSQTRAPSSGRWSEVPEKRQPYVQQQWNGAFNSERREILANSRSTTLWLLRADVADHTLKRSFEAEWSGAAWIWEEREKVQRNTPLPHLMMVACSWRCWLMPTWRTCTLHDRAATYPSTAKNREGQRGRGSAEPTRLVKHKMPNQWYKHACAHTQHNVSPFLQLKWSSIGGIWGLKKVARLTKSRDYSCSVSRHYERFWARGLSQFPENRNNGHMNHNPQAATFEAYWILRTSRGMGRQ